jgi:hypothetical protein
MPSPHAERAAPALAGNGPQEDRLAGTIKNTSYTTNSKENKSADVTVASIEVSWRVQVRVTLTEWRGRRKLHIREYHPGPVAGTWWPSRQGVALDLQRLPELIQALEAAEAEANKRGFLPGGEHD